MPIADLLGGILLARARRDFIRTNTLRPAWSRTEPMTLDELGEFLESAAANAPEHWTLEKVMLVKVAEAIAELGSQELMDALKALLEVGDDGEVRANPVSVRAPRPDRP